MCLAVLAHTSLCALSAWLSFPHPACSKAIHLTALLWVLYTCIAFMLPTAFPVTWEFFNYAPVAILLWAVLFMGWWYLQARFWFKGPTPDFEQDAAAQEEQFLTVEEQQDLKASEGKQA